jgi:hypothetical protein
MKTALNVLFLLITQHLFSQNWTWIHGRDSINIQGVYGTLNVSSPTVMPGGRDYPCTWTDASGKLWMFGGRGRGNSSQWGYLDDMWMYDTGTNEWTWANGTPTVMPAYLSYTPSNSTSLPTERYQAACWTSTNGDLWMYGGACNAYLADLWKYTISTNQWTLVAGSTTPNVAPTGSVGVSSTTATPGSRYGSATWTDLNGDFWLFGGYNGNYLADLWKYEIVTNEWTLVKKLVGNYGYGYYGTMSVPSSTNCPGGRYSPESWTDLQGNLWLYGGIGNSCFTVSPNSGGLGDLWRYEIQNNEWAWMGGALKANEAAVYGTLGVESYSNFPGERFNSTTWTDASGDLLLFAGINNKNDLWKYNVVTSNWTWLKGNTTTYVTGDYGTLGVTSATNNPGWRDGAGKWRGPNNTLWAFGGYGAAATSTNGFLGDLWRLDYCSAPTPSIISGSGQVVCAGASASLSVFSAGSINWYSSSTSSAAIATGSVIVTPTLAAGTYTYFVQATGCTVNPIRTPVSATAEAFPVVSITNGSLCSGKIFTLQPTGAYNYTFSSGSATVSPAATSQYTITGASPHGCTSTNTAIVTVSVFVTPTITVNNGSVCAGNAFSLIPSGAATYSYSGGSAVFYPPSSNIYTVTGVSLEGCTSTAISSVTVFPAPVINVSGGSVCAGDSFTIVPSGAVTYSFQGGGPVVTPASTATYSIFGTDINGCTSLSPTPVQVIVNPNPTLSLGSATICSGDTHVFVPFGADSYTISGGSFTVSPAVTTIYTLSGNSSPGCAAVNTPTVQLLVNPRPLINANSGSICVGQSFTINPSGASSYTVTGNNFVVSPAVTSGYSVSGTNSLGCASSLPAVVTVTVFATPLPAVTANSGSICAGNTFTIIPGGAFSYTITGGNYFVSPSSNTSYVVSGSNSLGCVSTNSAIATVTVFQLPELFVTSTNSIICNAGAETVTLNVSGASSYLWIPSISGSSLVVSPAATTIYTVIGTSANGCSNTTYFTQLVDVCMGVIPFTGRYHTMVYPNPFLSEIRIDGEVGEINIIDSQGKKVFSCVAFPGKPIDLSHLSPGIYFLQGNKTSAKIVKME